MKLIRQNETYHYKKVASTNVSNEYQRQCNGQAKTDADSQKICPGKCQADSIVAESSQQDDCQKDQLKD